ncbi:hypothetical protein ACFUIT_33195 [Streptomyces sp. NPDC057239]|uniref:hypothetical protein n=1 Tax=Streptomyces sp. NPDC057239 TaxID=3346061 RepID=UPI0036443C3A
MVINWNADKPHRCPRCHTITVDSPSSREVYTCCNCGTQFARFPRLQRALRHAGITCEACTKRHPVPVDGHAFGFLRRRHAGVGTTAQRQFEAWLHETDEVPDHRDRVRYLNTLTSRADAMAEIAEWQTFCLHEEEDRSPVIAVVVDEDYDRWGPTTPVTVQDGFSDGSLEVYGVGIMGPHPRRGRFHAVPGTFTWGLIAPCGLEGLYSQPHLLPEALLPYAPQT